MVRQAERMITGARGDDPAFPLLRRELEERVARASFLEGTRALKIIEFAHNARAGDFRQRDRFRTRRDNNSTRDSTLRGTNVGQSDGHELSIAQVR